MPGTVLGTKAKKIKKRFLSSGSPQFNVQVGTGGDVEECEQRLKQASSILFREGKALQKQE